MNYLEIARVPIKRIPILSGVKAINTKKKYQPRRKPQRTRPTDPAGNFAEGSMAGKSTKLRRKKGGEAGD